jgi:hypothetical protein
MGRTWEISPKVIVQNNLVAKTSVCVSDLVAHGEGGRGKESAAI